MIIVGACCVNGGVGYDGKLPWKHKADMKHFRKITMGKTILVGRKTFEKMPPLKGRNVVVLSRSGNLLKDYIGKDVMLIGGPEVWNEAFRHDCVDKIILTYINIDVECDSYFPLGQLRNYDIESVDKISADASVIIYNKKLI